MRAIEPDALRRPQAVRRQDRLRSAPRWNTYRQSPVRPKRLQPAAGCHLYPSPELWRGERLPGKRKGYSFDTMMGGAYEHAAEHDNQPPYNLPESWMKCEVKARSEDSAEFRFDRRHHRRQLRIAHGEQERRSRRHHFRRQHRIAAVELRLSATCRAAPFPWIHAAFRRRCGKIYGATALADELSGPRPTRRRPENKARLRINGPLFGCGPFRCFA